MKHKIFITFLILFSVNTLSAQQQISLSEALEIGLKNNFQIQIAQKRAEIAKNNNTRENAGNYPTVNFNLSSNNIFNRSNNPASFIPEITSINNGLVPSLDGQWVIFNGFKADLNMQQFEELQLQSESQVKVAIENNIQQIMLAYYQAIIQKEQLQTLQEVLNLSEDRIEYQEVRQEFGQAGAFDIIQASDAFLNDSTALLIQKNSYETTLLNLKLAMGEENPSVRYEPSEKLSSEAKQYIFEDLEEQMLKDNVNAQQLLIAQRLANVNSELSKSNRLPTISVAGGISYNQAFFWQSGENPFTQQAFGSDFSNQFNIYLNGTLTYNIFDGGARKRSIANSKIEEEIAQLNINDLQRSLSAQLRIALQNYNNQFALLDVTEKLIENAEKNLQISEERLRGGQISSFDYRAVQLAYINASQARLSTLFNLKNAEIELIRLIGGFVKK